MLFQTKENQSNKSFTNLSVLGEHFTQTNKHEPTS